MVVSDDDDYAAAASDDEDLAGRGGPRTRGKALKQDKENIFEVSRTWEALVEAPDGTITSAVEGLLEAGKRKRYMSTRLEYCSCELMI